MYIFIVYFLEKYLFALANNLTPSILLSSSLLLMLEK